MQFESHLSKLNKNEKSFSLAKTGKNACVECLLCLWKANFIKNGNFFHDEYSKPFSRTRPSIFNYKTLLFILRDKAPAFSNYKSPFLKKN